MAWMTASPQMTNELLLLSGKDIPFPEARINIHQPRLYEISFISEESFFTGCQFLNISKDTLSKEDKMNLSNKSDFEIFMLIMNEKGKASYKTAVKMILALLFPDYQLSFEKDKIVLKRDDFKTSITQLNFPTFKQILNDMFVLKDADMAGEKYNPADGAAKRLVDKFKAREKKLAAQKSQSAGDQKISVLSRYVSILAVGEGKNINELMEYTVFQLKDEFTRFQMKQKFDMSISAKLACASDIEDVKNWMEDIYSS